MNEQEKIPGIILASTILLIYFLYWWYKPIPKPKRNYPSVEDERSPE
jgi:hypothetical protein